eukprot:10978245-Lingulodinium_polyedra.AAC.1
MDSSTERGVEVKPERVEPEPSEDAVPRPWAGTEPPGKGRYPASDFQRRNDGIWVRLDASNRGYPVDQFGE